MTVAGLCFLISMASAGSAFAQVTLTAPSDLQAIDTPNDGGESLTVLWAPSPMDGPDARYQVLFGEASATDATALKAIAEFLANTRYVKEAKSAWWTRKVERTWHQYVIRNGKGVEMKNGSPYTVTVAMRKGEERAIGPLLQATPSPDWFNWNQFN